MLRRAPKGASLGTGKLNLADRGLLQVEKDSYLGQGQVSCPCCLLCCGHHSGVLLNMGPHWIYRLFARFSYILFSDFVLEEL